MCALGHQLCVVVIFDTSELKVAYVFCRAYVSFATSLCMVPYYGTTRYSTPITYVSLKLDKIGRNHHTTPYT